MVVRDDKLKGVTGVGAAINAGKGKNIFIANKLHPIQTSESPLGPYF